MQRMSSLIPTWERTRSVDGKNNGQGGGSNGSGGSAFGRVFGWADKMAAANRVSTGGATPGQQMMKQLAMSKMGREAYWPSSLEKECEKAARILKSFCIDGFLSYEFDAGSEPASPTTTTSPASPTSQIQIMKKVPPRIVQNAVGLAIFSCMRSGLWMSGSGGSGILIARKADGTWSPPSGILLHTADLGFIIGVDIYDCVLVINSVAALEMFTRPRVTLGTDVALTVGPVAPLGLLENDFAKWKELSNTVLTYLKARGQHRAVQLDGSLVTERGNENEKFYGTGSVDVLDILAGNVRKSIPEIAPLFEAIKAAEGRTDYDFRVMQELSQQPAPGDASIETPVATPVSPTRSTFGVPSADDPDPFGVIALEMAGLEIREAGSKHRPISTQFEYVPSPVSPFSSNFNRQSVDTYLSHSNRGSYMSSRTQATTMTDAFTQTDAGESVRTSPSLGQGGDAKSRGSPEIVPVVKEPEEIDYTKIDTSPLENLNCRQSFDVAPVSVVPVASEPAAADNIETPEAVSRKQSEARPALVTAATTDSSASAAPTAYVVDEVERDGDADDEDDEDDDEEEPIIFEVATAAQPTRTAIMATQVTQVISAKGALVTIPKRIAPALPPRNPARSSRSSKNDYGGDVSGLQSPMKSSFDSSVEDGGNEKSKRANTAQDGDDDATLQTTPTATRVHHRNSSSVYTAIHDTPATPTNLLLTEPSSSADEESIREPQTPKVHDDIRPKLAATGNSSDPAHEAGRIQAAMKMTSNNINAAAVEVV